ncbi:ROK family glucokinase [Streptomyces mirabilis]|uniref:ROK family glucokinase n=1 Tax=Streptomyces mirabilis TaxID=68239 RepID=UPI0036CF19E1
MSLGSRDLTIGVDLGGTKITAGVVNPDGKVLSHLRVPTPHQPEAVGDAVASAVDQVRQGWDDVHAVGIGAAGYVDERRSTVRFAPNLGWHEKPLRDLVQRRCGLPTVVENDANAAAWGEFRYGAAADHDDMVMVTVGTGLGGGIVIAGKLFRGRFGMGGEIGHYRAVPDGLPCGCGQHGCIEQYASGTAHTRRARAAAAADLRAAAGILALGDGTPDGIEGGHITQAARGGDRFALELFERTGKWVGQVLADLGSVLDPAVFVLGGGVGDTGELLRRSAEAAYRARLGGGKNRIFSEVLTATVGPDAGLIGAAALARLS